MIVKHWWERNTLVHSENKYIEIITTLPLEKVLDIVKQPPIYGNADIKYDDGEKVAVIIPIGFANFPYFAEVLYTLSELESKQEMAQAIKQMHATFGR